MKKLRVLIACEESQMVCKAFREKGHEAYSCDLQECSGGRPEWHIQDDVLKILNGMPICLECGKMCIFDYNSFSCDDCERLWPLKHWAEFKKWDLIIAHPPCTYLTVTGNKWMKPEFIDRFPNRQNQREKAIEFFLKIANAKCDHIAIENPVGIMSTIWRKPNQYVHPYHFGDPHSKKTGFWLKGLSKLKPTSIVKPQMYTYKNGRKDPVWHVESMKLPPLERQRIRSKTFLGIAKAMASQWSEYILNN